jgi:hypothetical protein
MSCVFELQSNSDIAIQNGHPFPGARTVISRVPVIRAQKLTSSGAVKTTLAIDLDISVSYFVRIQNQLTLWHVLTSLDSLSCSSSVVPAIIKIMNFLTISVPLGTWFPTKLKTPNICCVGFSLIGQFL